MAKAIKLKYTNVFVFVSLCLFVMAFKALIFNMQETTINFHVPLIPSYSGSHQKILSQRTQKGSLVNYNTPRLDEFVRKFLSRYNGDGSVFDIDVKESYDAFLDRLNEAKPRGAMFLSDRAKPGMNYVDRFIRGISQNRMYDPYDKQFLQDIISNLSNLPIVSAEKAKYDSTLKVSLLFADDTIGRVKFIRAPRDYESADKVYYNDDLERHTSEIAGYHLDRVLGFNKAIPTVGRQLNMTSDLAQFLSDPASVVLVYISPIGNRCFAAICRQPCGPDHPFCGRGDMIEAAVSLTLPLHVLGNIVGLDNPFMRSPYFNQSTWLQHDKYCNNTVRGHSSMIGSRTFLDLIDISVFDYFTGNMDRHHIETFYSLGNESFVLHLDNGRGFTRWSNDDDTALVILTQCCQIRLSTLASFIKLYAGPEHLSDVMRRSLSSDPLSPILLEPHLDALDRRLAKVIKAMADCIDSGRSWNDVVINDVSM